MRGLPCEHARVNCGRNAAPPVRDPYSTRLCIRAYHLCTRGLVAGCASTSRCVICAAACVAGANSACGGSIPLWKLDRIVQHPLPRLGGLRVSSASIGVGTLTAFLLVSDRGHDACHDRRSPVIVTDDSDGWRQARPADLQAASTAVHLRCLLAR
jgi:hypothetical protein